MTRYVMIGGYLLFVMVGLVLWLITRSTKTPIAPVGEMIDRLMHHRTTRIGILCAWLWIGWHFLVSVVHQAEF